MSIEIKTLFRMYLNDEMSEEQFLRLYDMLAGKTYDPRDLEEVVEEMMDKPGFIMGGGGADKKEILAAILAGTSDRQPVEATSGTPVRRMRPTLGRWIAVAAVVIGIACGMYLILYKSHSPEAGQLPYAGKGRPDVAPGRSGAILTLADGRQVELDSAGNGMLQVQGNTTVLKQGGQLTYAPKAAAGQGLLYNTLSTPKGRQFQLRLADGTRVWLNAASSIRYPTLFEGNERNVEVTGEAYFEVAGDPQKAFKVKVGEMTVEVLGTHFNINSYDDENTVRTTLLEGRVRVAGTGVPAILAPGQQAQSKEGSGIRVVSNVDLDEVVAWKDGNFQFENIDIHAIMRQLARWYDIDVQYDASITSHFGGIIARNVALSKVLEMLQKTGTVSFEIKGRTVIVKTKHT